LFLDLDGTLLEFAEHPQDAAPSARLRALLPLLAPATDGAVALVSGRPIAELDRLLSPYRFAAAGIHGIEQRRQLNASIESQGDAALLDGVRELIRNFVSARRGLICEDKQTAVALHYRQRPDLEDEVAEFIAELGRQLPATLDLLPGKKVAEIKLTGSSKGRAIRAFMDAAPFRDRTPVFIGDDVTDEQGFAVVNELDGTSVKVGSDATLARWRLHDVNSVLCWLEHSVRAARTERSEQ
jgi:trehalose 6-phosphate phosphatase